MGDRKARLAALAAKAGRTKQVASSEEEEAATAPDNTAMEAVVAEEESSSKRAISFRNYAPTDDSLDPMMEGESPPKRSKTTTTTTTTAAGNKSNNNKNNNTTTLAAASSSSSALEEALQEAQQEVSTSNKLENEEITTMAPKKINWDLKRNIEDKIAKLERRTQKAIVELLKARLEKEASEQANSDSDLD